MSPLQIIFTVVAVAAGILAALIYSQWASRRLERRLRRDITDQVARYSRAFDDRLRRLEDNQTSDH